jgi:tetratricopeptide (TPR) repeat protein
MRNCLIAICCAMLICGGALAFAQGNPSSAGQQDKASDSARAAEESSSKDTRVDLSPPKDDQKNHPMSSVPTAGDHPDTSDVQEMQPWDPHKAAKDIEVGDFYFRRKNYKAAIERYRDALVYKSNDAIAQYRLAESLDKTGESQEAVEHYKAYLKILPGGPDAKDAQKALERITGSESKARADTK